MLDVMYATCICVSCKEATSRIQIKYMVCAVMQATAQPGLLRLLNLQRVSAAPSPVVKSPGKYIAQF